jgi:hypothetical protein
MQQSAQSIGVHRNLHLLSTIDIIIDIECQIEQLRAELTGIVLTAEERVAALADTTQLRKAMTEIALNTLRDNRRRLFCCQQRRVESGMVPLRGSRPLCPPLKLWARPRPRTAVICVAVLARSGHW